MINKEKKFVFVHITKTGGQSIENIFGFHVKGKEIKNSSRWGWGWSHEHNHWRAHMTIGEYLTNGFLTKKEFDSFFKFSFVRNPWARAVSEWRWSFKLTPIRFNVFLKDKWSIIKHYPSNGVFIQHNRPQYVSIYDDDKLLVDFVGKLENIESDWKIVADKIGVGTPLPHINRTNHKHYTEYYTTTKEKH